MLDRTADMPDPQPPHGGGSDFFNAIGAAELARKARTDWRVPGEDVPAWLATAFAVIGMTIAVASASAWQTTLLPPPQSAPTLTAPDLAASPAQDDASALVARVGRETALSESTRPVPVNPSPVAAALPAAPPLPVDSGAATAPLATAMAQMLARNIPVANCFSALRIPFARNSAQPSIDDVHSSAEPLRRWLSKHSDAIVVIEGRSDTAGPEDYNVLLSYSRAKAIAGLLKREGIPSQQTTIRASGSSEATGKAMQLASDRSAVLTIAGVEDCGSSEIGARTP